MAVAPKTKAKTTVTKKTVKKLYIQNVIRWINREGHFGDGGSEPLNVVNAELDVYHQQGYVLQSTHYLGESPEAYGILYIFVLDG